MLAIRVLRILAGLVIAGFTGAEMLSIGDSGYPHIYLMQPTVPVHWHRKAMAVRRAGSQAIRINTRGIRFISASYSSLVLGSSPGDSSSFHNALGWKGIHCRGSTYGLCEISGGVNGAESLVFPNAPHDVYVSSTSGDERIDDFIGSPCPETKTNRVASTSGDGRRYDISVCNVLGVGNDYVYLPYESMLYVLSEPITFQVLTAISILTVIMAVVLAHNLEYSLGSIEQSSGSLVSLTGMLSLLFLTTFATGNPDVLLPYVTLEDRASFVVLFTYVLYYTVRAAFQHYVFVRHGMDSPVNPVLATLCVVSLRLHGSLDNSYTTLLTFLIATRLLHKLSTYDCTPMRGVDILFDSALVTMLIFTGLVPQHNNDPTVVALYVLQGAYAAQGLNRVMLDFSKRMGRRDADADGSENGLKN